MHAEHIGKTGTFTTKEGWKLPVQVVDARTAFGRLDFSIQPLDSDLQPIWVGANRVQFNMEKK